MRYASLLGILLCCTASYAETDIKSAAKAFVEQLERGDFAAAVKPFDATMRQVVSADKLKEIWDGLSAKLGPLQRQLATRVQKAGKYEIVFVTCQFEKAKLDAKVVFDRTGKISGLFFVPPKQDWKPPSYAKPDRYREKEVTVGSGKWALPGTLTIPVEDGPFPAVVLVHGSGPNERDETIGLNKPFRDLAWGLASRGIAVLRYDKRTKVHGAKMAADPNLTVEEEVINDVGKATRLLGKTPGIDPKRVFVAGHSLGGMLVPWIGAADEKIYLLHNDPQQPRPEKLAGLIVLAGNTRPLEDLFLAQHKYLFSLDGTISDEEQKALDDLAAKVARVKDPKLSSETPAAELPTGVPVAYWLALRPYHPADVAKGLSHPMLILQGERDYQVTMVDFAGWKTAMAGRKDVTLKSYPSLNHLFMAGTGKSTPDEYAVPGHVAEEVVRDIARWVRLHGEAHGGAQ